MKTLKIRDDQLFLEISNKKWHELLTLDGNRDKSPN